MLKNAKIILQPLEKRHLQDLRNLRNNQETNYYLTSVMPINEYQQEEWFRKLCLDDSKMYFAIENHQGLFCGVVRCDEWDKINRSIRIGVDIVPDLRQRGLATQTYKLLLPYLFNNLNLNRVWLFVADYNKVALHLYQKLGFKLEGKQRQAIYRHNKFNNYLMLSLLKNEYDLSL